MPETVVHKVTVTAVAEVWDTSPGEAADIVARVLRQALDVLARDSSLPGHVTVRLPQISETATRRM